MPKSAVGGDEGSAGEGDDVEDELLEYGGRRFPGSAEGNAG